MPSIAERPVRRRPSWRLSIVLSLVLHVVVGAGLWFWLREAEPAAKPVCLTQCAFIEPDAAMDPNDEDLAELEPFEIEAFEELPDIEPVDVPEEVELPTETSSVAALPDTPALTVTPRMFQRRLKAAPAPVDPAPAVASPPVVATVAAKAPPVRRRASKPKARFIPPSARYYPAEARRRGIEGTAIVVITVDSQGRVIDVRISRSTGSRLLDDAAVKLMYDARFVASGGEQKAKAPVHFVLR